MAASVVSDARCLDSSFQSLVIKDAPTYSEGAVNEKESEKRCEICKEDDDDPKEYWDKFVVPFLKGDVLPSFLCGENEKVISWFCENVRRRGIEHWKKHDFDTLPRQELDSKWFYGLPEQVISIELIKLTYRCSLSCEGFNTCCMCDGELKGDAVNNHEIVCHGHSHPHPDKCCVCHVQGHEEAGSCYLCNENYYLKGEDCCVLGGIKCGHLFHVDCIKSCLKKKNICPICKKKAIFPGSTRTGKGMREIWDEATGGLRLSG